MITCKKFSATGQPMGDVTLELRKSIVAARIVSALQEGESSITVHDLTRLDSGTISFERIRELFTPAEIRVALQRRRETLGIEMAELQRVQATLDDAVPGEWDGANGGDAAQRRGTRQKP